MTVIRAAAVIVAGWVTARAAASRGEPIRRTDIGWGLLPQGELALGLTVAIVSFFPDTGGVLEAVVAAVFLSNIAGAGWMRRHVFGSVDRPVP
jgi:hypothetical protein